MAVTGNVGPPVPPVPPVRPPGPPPGPPSGPPTGPPGPPGPPSGPASTESDGRRGSPLHLRVSRRMLWVGTAAFPLHNITRVEAYRIKPDRGAAVLRFLRWLGVAVIVYIVVAVSEDEARIGADNNPVMLVVVVALGVFLLKELLEPAKPALAVELASGSTVLVTLPSMQELQDIAELIARAIDNPAAEFSAVVRQFNHTNNYGTVINMNGGRNNRGISL